MPLLSAIDHRMKRDTVAEVLREAIFQGELSPGERLQEERLATLLEAGRGPVREALLKLEAEGLIVREPYKGARVAMPSRRDIEELFEVREVLEAMVTRQAAPHITREDIEQLRRIIDLRKNPESHGEVGVENLNLAFHEVIYKRCPNRQLSALVLQLWGRFPKSTWQLRSTDRNVDHVEQGTAEYSAILAAFEAGDADAAADSMVRHVRRARETLVELVEPFQPSVEQESLEPVAAN